MKNRMYEKISMSIEPLSLEEMNVYTDAVLSLLENSNGIMHSTTNTYIKNKLGYTGDTNNIGIFIGKLIDKGLVTKDYIPSARINSVTGRFELKLVTIPNS